MLVGTIAAGVVVPLLLASTAAAFHVPKSCPPVAEVNATLHQKDKAPTTTKTPYGKVCTYRGTGILSTKITFQKDTTSTFAAGEKAAAAAEPVVKVHHLGQSAWGTKAGGLLEVYDQGETLKILAPLTPLARLEALARKIV